MHSSQVLLEKDLFQRCLVACCLEISTSTNRLSFDFPLLLHILGLASYHFWRVCVLSLLAMQVCVNHFVSLISQSTAHLFISILSEVFWDSQHRERRLKRTLVRIILWGKRHSRKSVYTPVSWKLGGLWETGEWQPKFKCKCSWVWTKSNTLFQL